MVPGTFGQNVGLGRRTTKRLLRAGDVGLVLDRQVCAISTRFLWLAGTNFHWRRWYSCRAACLSSSRCKLHRSSSSRPGRVIARGL